MLRTRKMSAIILFQLVPSPEAKNVIIVGLRLGNTRATFTVVTFKDLHRGLHISSFSSHPVLLLALTLDLFITAHLLRC